MQNNRDISISFGGLRFAIPKPRATSRTRSFDAQSSAPVERGDAQTYTRAFSGAAISRVRSHELQAQPTASKVTPTLTPLPMQERRATEQQIAAVGGRGFLTAQDLADFDLQGLKIYELLSDGLAHKTSELHLVTGGAYEATRRARSLRNLAVRRGDKIFYLHLHVARGQGRNSLYWISFETSPQPKRQTAVVPPPAPPLATPRSAPAPTQQIAQRVVAIREPDFSDESIYGPRVTASPAPQTKQQQIPVEFGLRKKYWPKPQAQTDAQKRQQEPRAQQMLLGWN